MSGESGEEGTSGVGIAEEPEATREAATASLRPAVPSLAELVPGHQDEIGEWMAHLLSPETGGWPQHAERDGGGGGDGSSLGAGLERVHQSMQVELASRMGRLGRGLEMMIAHEMAQGSSHSAMTQAGHGATP
jgi:hypothetical protein